MGSDTAVALRRIVLGYRAIAAVWVGALAVVGWLDGRVDATVALVTAGGVAAWSALTVLLGERHPEQLASWPWVVADVAVAAAVIVLPGLVTGRSTVFFGGYPFSAVAVAAWARSWPAAIGAAIALASASVIRPGRVEPGATAVQAIANDYLFYVLGGAVLAWGIGVMLRTEAERRAAESALADARAEQARAEERARTAAHLHDSVLQTLALVQRRAEDPAAVRSLSRRQERELREWLYGMRSGRHAPVSLGEAVQRVASDVEERFGVAVEVVRVGDAPLEERLVELVAAAGEAMTNAAKHAQVDTVSVYLEATAGDARVFVRDRGRGFDPAAVPDGRLGITDSIVGRMHRCGGRAEIRSSPGAGTEVELSVAPEVAEERSTS